MEHRTVLKILGVLLLLQAAAMFGCGAFARFDPVAGDEPAMKALFLSGLVTCAVAVGLVLLGGLRRKITRLMRREAVLIVGLGWIVSGVFGSLPYLLCPPHLAPADAVFEAVSGFTTTGSSVLTDIEAWPRGLLLWRACTQLLGGLGILVLFVAVLSFLGVGSKSLFQNESSFRAGQAGVARIHDTALILLKLYLGFALVCLLGLRAMGMTWFNAVCHTMATVSTGGFSPHNSSVGHYSGWSNGWAIEAWILLFMLLCSVNFVLYIVILKRNWRRLRSETDARWYLLILLGAVSVITLATAIGNGTDFIDALRGASFTVVSIATTTGFGTVDYLAWPVWCQVVLALLMLSGGCAGSTSGGFKIGRLVVFIKFARHEIARTFRPHLVFRETVNGRPVDADTRSRVLFFLALYLLVGLFSILAVAALESSAGITLETAASCVIATLSNIGPAFGTVGPASNFAHLQPVTKLFLSLLMILGRLELFAVLVLFLPSAWRRF